MLKKPNSFMVTRAKISAVRASGVQCLFFFVPDAALNQGERLFE